MLRQRGPLQRRPHQRMCLQRMCLQRMCLQRMCLQLGGRVLGGRMLASKEPTGLDPFENHRPEPRGWAAKMAWTFALQAIQRQVNSCLCFLLFSRRHKVLRPYHVVELASSARLGDCDHLATDFSMRRPRHGTPQPLQILCWINVYGMARVLPRLLSL
jgi:hypothetical protein